MQINISTFKKKSSIVESQYEILITQKIPKFSQHFQTFFSHLELNSAPKKK